MTRIADKARRLLNSGAVTVDPHPARVYNVVGDTGTYRVVLSASLAICTCPARDRCSHIEAAAAHWTASPEDVSRWDSAALERRQRTMSASDRIFDRFTR